MSEFFVPDGWNARQWSTLQWGDALVIQNNPWGAISPTHLDVPIPRDRWYQAIGLNDDGNPSAIFSYPRDYFDSSKVIAYPEIVYGNKFGTLDSGAVGFPFQVRAMKQVDIDFRYSMHAHPMRPSENPIYNVAVETFFHDRLPIVGPGNPEHDPRNTQVKFELMVWLESPLDSGDISLGSPIDEFTDRYGNTFDIYSFSPSYAAFVRRYSGWNTNKFCWSDFIGAVNKQDRLDDIDPEWYISAFEGGPEIWTGSGLFEWKAFDVDVWLLSDKELQGPAGNRDLYTQLSRCYGDLSRIYDKLAEQ